MEAFERDLKAFERDLKATLGTLMEESELFAKLVWGGLANVIWVNKKQNDKFSCSFRYAGGLISEITGRGNYLTYYCSGDYETVPNTMKERLGELGWKPRPYQGSPPLSFVDDKQIVVCPECKNELTPEQAFLCFCCPLCGSEKDVIQKLKSAKKEG